MNSLAVARRGLGGATLATAGLSASASRNIVLDGTAGGTRFDGLGAVSGGAP